MISGGLEGWGRAGAEDGGAYADAGGSFLDGGGEVVGHAHGELGEGGVGGEVLVAELAELAEVGAGFFSGLGDVSGPWGDGHEAGRDEGFERAQGFEKGGQVGGGQAVLGFFGGELDFDQDGDALAEGAGGVVEAGGDAEGVDGVDGVEEGGCGGGFVRLEGSDEVHFEVGETGGGG